MSVDTPNETEGGERRRGGPLVFYREVRAEARKVTWATRQEVTISTIMVVIMGLLAALFFFIVDTVLRLILAFVLGLNTPPQ
jgi:preprotein translocase subunit SecE